MITINVKETRRSFLKKPYGKLILWLGVLPTAVIFLMTSIYCLFSNMYLEWFWVTEWMYTLPQTAADYMEMVLVYLLLGLTAHSVFFEKGCRGALASLLSAVALFAVPLLQYVIRHLFFVNTMDRSVMAEWFNIDVFDAIYLLFYYALGILVLWILRAIWAWILLQKPMAKGKIFTVHHPVGLAMTIYFAAHSAIATIMFISAGGANFGALLFEYGINLAGFAVSVLGAFIAAKKLEG